MQILGLATAKKAFYQAPLYSYFLALIYKIFGHNYLVPRLFQSLIGAVNCVMVMLVGERLFGRREGLLAGCIAALYGPFIYFEGELLRPVLIIFLALLMILCILHWSESRPIWAAVAGLITGLSVITRENILIVVPVVIIYFWLSAKHRRWYAPALFLLLMVIPIIPVTVSNYKKSGDFVPVSTQGAMNFYIGNSAESDRLTALQPGIEWNKMAFAPREELGGEVKPSEFQWWFLKKELQDVSTAPSVWIGKLTKKLYLVFYGEELTPNSDINLYREYSWLLRTLIFKCGPFIIPFGLLFPLFVLGVSCQKADRGKWLLIGYIVSYSLSVALFHVRARYRLAIVPAMIPFAASGILFLSNQIRMRDMKKVALCFVIVTFSAALVNVPWANVSFAKRFPTNYFLGLALAKKGSYELALEQFEKQLQKDPHYPELRHSYGLTLIRLGKDREGLEQITIARDLAPDYAPIRTDLGNLYKEKAEKLKANIDPQYEGGLETAGKEKALKKSKLLMEKAIMEYEAAAKYDPYDESIKYRLALLYDHAGYPDKFKKKLREYAVQHMQDNPDYAIGIVLDQLERHDEAIIHYKAAARINPTAVDIHNKLGVALFKSGSYEEARSHFAESLRIEPENDEVHLYIGNILVQLGRQEEAIKHFTEALRINPDNELAHNNIAMASVQQGDLENAIKHYAIAIRLTPESAELHNNMGVALFKSNDFMESVKHYHRAIDLNPRYATAYNNLANVLVEQGRFDEAIKNYHMALKIRPDYTEALNNTGVAFARQEKYQEAIEYFVRALRLNPNYFQARTNLELALTEISSSKTKR
jgi:tetratricopeptide (TPR) repeat protein